MAIYLSQCAASCLPPSFVEKWHRYIPISQEWLFPISWSCTCLRTQEQLSVGGTTGTKGCKGGLASFYTLPSAHRVTLPYAYVLFHIYYISKCTKSYTFMFGFICSEIFRRSLWCKEVPRTEQTFQQIWEQANGTHQARGDQEWCLPFLQAECPFVWKAWCQHCFGSYHICTDLMRYHRERIQVST